MSSIIQGKNAFIGYAKVIAESKLIDLRYCPTFDNFSDSLSEEDKNTLTSTIEYIANSNHNVADLACHQDPDVEMLIGMYIDQAEQNRKVEDKTYKGSAEPVAKKRKPSKLVQKFCDQVGITDPEIITILGADDVRECYRGKGVGHMYLAFRSKLISMWHETNNTKYLYFAFLRINAKTLANLPVVNYFGIAEYFDEARNTPYF